MVGNGLGEFMIPKMVPGEVKNPDGLCLTQQEAALVVISSLGRDITTNKICVVFSKYASI